MIITTDIKSESQLINLMTEFLEFGIERHVELKTKALSYCDFKVGEKLLFSLDEGCACLTNENGFESYPQDESESTRGTVDKYVVVELNEYL